MDTQNIYTVLVTIVTVLGGASAWRFYEKRAMHKERDEDFIRHDCKDRISKLEALLEASAKEKDDLRVMVLNLTKEVAALSVKVEFLTKENEDLHKKTKTSRKVING
jgi:hypothetical protein